MASDRQCSCCPSCASCAACLPQCSSKPYVSLRNRAERPLKYELDCGPQNCSIFGSHDTNPLPEHQCNQQHIKPKEENKNSLGSPIGLVASNVNFKTEGKTGDIMQVRYATYLKAFARLHLNDEKEWDSQLMDDIMKEGLNLYTASQNREDADVTVESDVYMPNEKEVLREFELSGFTFHVELMPPFKVNVATTSAMGAKGDGVELTLGDMMSALKSFFHQHKYGLLKITSYYAMVWHTKDAYFLFDACGRRVTDFKADKAEGVAMLMCFKSLENIRHLMVNLSGLQNSDPVIIRELKVVKVITPKGGIMQLDFGSRNHQYEVVNDDYAFLRSELHLTLNKRDLLRNRSGLPVAVAAIAVSKIEHPATWDIKMVDRIICFGVSLCQSRWFQCKSAEAIEVSEFPTHFTLGQFHIHIEIVGQTGEGTWRCVPGSRHSELAHAIKEAFNAGHHKLILQINCQMYAIWKKQEFIYLLDPYRHRILGKQNESKIYEQMEKSATVRMFRSFEVFLNVLNHILLDSNRTSQFSIHFVKVKNIQVLQKQKHGQARAVHEPKLDDYGEVISINEHICFEEAEDKCKAALGEISDYEDEDLKSDVDEIELRTSSSEEEVLEEEEAVGAELGEMEDVESSSSGEEKGDHKGKTQRNKTRGRGGKTRTNKGKQTKNGGKNKSKAGKSVNESEDEDVNSESEKTKKVRNTGKSDEPHKKTKNQKNKLAYENDDENEATETNIGGNKLIEKGADLDQKHDVEKDKINKDWNKKQEKDLSKLQHGDNDQNKAKDLSRDKEKNPSTEKDIKTGKGLSKNETKGLSKDEDISRGINISKDKNLSKGKDANNGKDLSQDKDLSQHKAIGNVKDLSESRDLGKDNDRSKEKYDTSQGKEILNQSIDDRSKSDLDKNKGSDRDINKENEILQTSHKFADNKDIAKDKENAKEVQESKSEDKFEASAQKSSDKHLFRKDRHQTAPNDGTEADDENEESFKKKPHYCSIPNPDCYPGYFKFPADMAIVGSESGSYESICKLFQAGFKVADRLLLMTPWDNFVVFRCAGKMGSGERHYFLFDGCTCNFDRFRHYDLSVGTAGLICFKHIHNLIEYIRHLRKSRRSKQQEFNKTADDICKEYNNKSFNLRV